MEKIHSPSERVQKCCLQKQFSKISGKLLFVFIIFKSVLYCIKKQHSIYLCIKQKTINVYKTRIKQYRKEILFNVEKTCVIDDFFKRQLISFTYILHLHFFPI